MKYNDLPSFKYSKLYISLTSTSEEFGRDIFYRQYLDKISSSKYIVYLTGDKLPELEVELNTIEQFNLIYVGYIGNGDCVYIIEEEHIINFRLSVDFDYIIYKV